MKSLVSSDNALLTKALLADMRNEVVDLIAACLSIWMLTAEVLADALKDSTAAFPLCFKGCLVPASTPSYIFETAV